MQRTVLFLVWPNGFYQKRKRKKNPSDDSNNIVLEKNRKDNERKAPDIK